MNTLANSAERRRFLEFRRTASAASLPIPAVRPIRFGVVVSAGRDGVTALLSDTKEVVQVMTALYADIADIAEGDEVGLEIVDGVWQASPVMSSVVDNPDGSREFYVLCRAGERRIAHVD